MHTSATTGFYSSSADWLIKYNILNIVPINKCNPFVNCQDWIIAAMKERPYSELRKNPGKFWQM